MTKKEVKLRNEVRVIGGKFRGRKLKFPSVPHLRPTPNRVRETVFNWLKPYIAGARCLDLFAGSGAMGFESLSRGANEVVFVEQNLKVVQQLQETLKILQCENAVVYHEKSEDFLKRVDQKFDIIFVDPPFGKNLSPIICQLIKMHRLLEKNGVVYIERESSKIKKYPSSDLSGWQALKEKEVGEVRFGLYCIKA